MYDYLKEPMAEAWAWESPVSGGTWQTHVRAGWGKPSPDATKFNLRPLYAADAFDDVGKAVKDASCKGTNCNASKAVPMHSAECEAEHDAACGEKLEAIFYEDENGTRWVYSDDACASISGPDSGDREIGRAALYVPYAPNVKVTGAPPTDDSKGDGA